jgi:type IV pilus assembly protein PilB
MVDPTNVSALEDIKFLTGFNVEPVLASETAVEQAIEKYYGLLREHQIRKAMDKLVTADDRELEVVEIDLNELEKSTEEPPEVKLCNSILTDAIRRNASEIHIESYEREYRVRFRIDDILESVMHPPMRLRDAITRRFKFMARLAGAEEHIPQKSGIRIRMQSRGNTREVYYSFSTLPTVWGEKIFMRVIDEERTSPNLFELGFEPESLQRFDQALLARGLVLLAGPMGSGKTTTLFSAINRYNVPEANVVTIEETIGYHLEGVNQVQVQHTDLPKAIAAALAENPQILAVGQISRAETADAAMKAALQGPLVLSTINANDTVTCIQRLASFDVSLNLIASSLRCICAQKLVRKICNKCRSPLETAESDFSEMGFRAGEAENIQFYRGLGCETCGQSGYHGRTGLFEVLTITDEIRDAIVKGLGAHEIRRIALGSGLITLRESGLHKVRDGITTAEEAFRHHLTWVRPPSELSDESEGHQAKDRMIRDAEGYLREVKLNEAAAVYEKWLEQNPEDWAVVRQAGDLYVRANDIEAAIKKYSQLASHNKVSGLNDGAIANYKMILRIAPKNLLALANIAELQAEQGRLPDAKKYYKTLATLHRQAGRDKPTIEVLKKIVDIDPSDLESRQQYVDFLGSHGEEKRAVAELLAVVDDLMQNELVAEAVPLLEKGLRMDGNHLELRCKLAQAAILQDDAPRAVVLLEAILEDHPKDKKLLSVLGQAYEKSGKIEQAEAIARQIAESDSSGHSSN